MPALGNSMQDAIEMQAATPSRRLRAMPDRATEGWTLARPIPVHAMVARPIPAHPRAARRRSAASKAIKRSARRRRHAARCASIAREVSARTPARAQTTAWSEAGRATDRRPREAELVPRSRWATAGRRSTIRCAPAIDRDLTSTNSCPAHGARTQVGNSTPALQITVGASQHGAPVGSQNSPRRGPVQLPQSAVHAPSRQQPQHSTSLVHAPPSGTHVVPQRRIPSAPGAQIPPQQRSLNAHSEPSGRQQIWPRGVPEVHSRPGGVEQHGSPPVMHSSPATTQREPPPKQRKKPAPVDSHPIRPPPSGQQFELAPMPPHTSPTGRHEVAFAHRMMGRPSTVTPSASQTPEQHSASLAHRSSCTRQPPRNWQRATGSSPAARQTVEQHEPL